MPTVYQDLEQTLAYHAAPALAGIKSADLVAWGNGALCTAPFFTQYVGQLARRGIALRVLGAGRPRCLLLVYRPQRLLEQLQKPQVAALLAQEGYPVEDGLDAMLDTLSQRLSQEEFPHEVGLFLGYPPEDVEGFRRHQGRNFKLCGCWKVYSDVEAAKVCFHRYKCCRAALCRRLAEGKELIQLFPAAG